MRNQRGSTATDYLLLTAVVAAVAFPIVRKYLLDPTVGALNASRGQMVGFIAQDRKQRVPNPWFSAEKMPDFPPPPNSPPPPSDPPPGTDPGTPPPTSNFPPPTNDPNAPNPPPTAGNPPPLGGNPGNPRPDAPTPGSPPSNQTPPPGSPIAGDPFGGFQSPADPKKENPWGSELDSQTYGSATSESARLAEKNKERISNEIDRKQTEQENQRKQKERRDALIKKGKVGNAGVLPSTGDDGEPGKFSWWFLLKIIIILLIFFFVILILFQNTKRRQ